ncbi:AzlC family ABC transporter permease [Methanolobus sp. WCC4]|uniref:AzlC family ABC transporter permease n=1 Tax=Methanolobus sp. WCC4 TaxID=3125784 RepID=UPI0030FCFBDF
MKGLQKSIPMEGFRMTIPVMFGYIPIGIAFGLFAGQYGFHWAYSFMMGLLIYSAATQFITIALVVAGSGVTEIVLTLLFLNLRHSFFGLSLLNRFANAGKIRSYLIFALTDETYALITGAKVPTGTSASRFYACIAGLNHAYWLIGSVIGALLGQFIEMNLTGLEFALTALFVVLSIEQYRNSGTRFPFIAALTAGLLSMVFAGSQNMLLISIITGTFLLLIYDEVQKNDI